MPRRALVVFAVYLAALLLLFVLVRQRERQAPAPRLFPYQEIVTAGAAEFDLDPLLVAAVIDNESGFDRRKRSPDGAVGLMQVLPHTGREAAAALDMDGYRDRDLWLPRVNVRIGCWYLAGLVRDFDGDLTAALAAYNAGPGRVRAWRRDARWQSRSGVERIPVMETRSYVTLVLRRYETYRRRSARGGRGGALRQERGRPPPSLSASPATLGEMAFERARAGGRRLAAPQSPRVRARRRAHAARAGAAGAHARDRRAGARVRAGGT